MSAPLHAGARAPMKLPMNFYAAHVHHAFANMRNSSRLDRKGFALMKTYGAR